MRHLHDVSLIFPLPLYFIEIELGKSVLVFILSFFAKCFSISARKSSAKVILSDTEPQKTSRMLRFMIIRLMRLERSYFLKFFLSSEELSAVREEVALSLVQDLNPCSREQLEHSLSIP